MTTSAHRTPTTDVGRTSAELPESMTAVVRHRYGSADAIELERLAVPTPGPRQVVVEVQASAIDRGVVHLLTGLPLLVRVAGFGVFRPKQPVLGSDVAGRVVAVGSDVDRFRVGDEVMGVADGAFAEYAVADADKLVLRPASVPVEHAAVSTISGITALQALTTVGRVRPGQRVLVIGASGGVGSFAVQIAASMGAEVTGICSTPNVELVRSLGAEHVIDYRTEDYLAGSERYDRILDNVAAQPMGRMRRLLTPDGRLLSNGAPVGGWFGGLDNVVKALAASMVNRQQARPFVSVSTGADARALKELVDAGKVKPAIGRTFPLEEGPQAVAHVATGHGQGKTIITMLPAR